MNPNNPLCPVCKWPSDKYLDGSCYTCYNIETGDEYMKYLKADPDFACSWDVAKRTGKATYFTGRACKKDKHPQEVSVNGPSHVCVACPRSIARQAGRKHYTPDTYCPDCDTDERRVCDNKCVQCCSATDSRRSGTQAFIDANPELIVTRDMARTVGFKVFRTGKPCSRGHAGFRYVTTNGCITCLRGK